MSSAMEKIEAKAEEPASCTDQFQWLLSTITGVEEKMKAILDLLEDYNSPMQNAEIHLRKKETIIKSVQDLCISYRSLAENYGYLKSVQSFKSSPHSSNRSMKNKEALEIWDDSQLETTDSNPESTVEDADIECEGSVTGNEHVNRFADNLVSKDGSSIKPEKAWFDAVTFKFSKLVEENTQLQVELIRRNSEKRETIIKLQNQVSRLRDEKETLQRTLSYFDHNKQHCPENSPRRKSMLLDKFFRGCSP